MKEKLKKNYKLIIGIIIGVIVSFGSAYATATISSFDISYDNKKSGLTSTNMKGAIDELNEKAKKLSSSKPCRVTNGTGTDLGDVIACGTEEFYVLKQVGDTVKTITKYPIEQGAVTTNPPVNITNPSYLQNEQCEKGLSCASGGASSGISIYKKNLEKIGISSLFDVKPVSIRDLNEVGICSATLTYCGSTEKFSDVSGECANLSTISESGYGFYVSESLVVDSSCSTPVASLIAAPSISVNSFGPPTKAIVIIPKTDIAY